MTSVVRRDGESFDSLLRRFRRKVTKGGILTAVRRKRYYVSDSEKHRIAMRKAIRKERQRQRRERRRWSRG